MTTDLGRQDKEPGADGGDAEAQANPHQPVARQHEDPGVVTSPLGRGFPISIWHKMAT
jgi:hypothetical protein